MAHLFILRKLCHPMGEEAIPPAYATMEKKPTKMERPSWKKKRGTTPEL
jgi:hypothetical protein